jgi:hypothetical protein
MKCSFEVEIRQILSKFKDNIRQLRRRSGIIDGKSQPLRQFKKEGVSP